VNQVTTDGRSSSAKGTEELFAVELTGFDKD
jgi:hypothetical protein